MGSILIVDDDSIDRMFVVSSLRKASDSLDVRECGDSSQAVAAARAQVPDVILLDINMPPPDGFEVLRQLRQDERFAGQAIYMMSGSTDPKDQARATDLGADGYLLKPASRDGYRELAETVAALACKPATPVSD